MATECMRIIPPKLNTQQIKGGLRSAKTYNENSDKLTEGKYKYQREGKYWYFSRSPTNHITRVELTKTVQSDGEKDSAEKCSILHIDDYRQTSWEEKTMLFSRWSQAPIHQDHARRLI